MPLLHDLPDQTLVDPRPHPFATRTPYTWMHSTTGRGRDCQSLDPDVLANKESPLTRSAISVPKGCWLIRTEFSVGTGAAIKHTVLEPMAVLRPFIKNFEVTQYLTELTHTLLPDTSLVACFRLDGMAIRHEARILPAAFLSGLQDRARTLTRLPGSCVLLTVFTEVGAAAFLREPLDLLFNKMMPLDNLLRHTQLEKVHEQLVEAGDHARRKEILERLLLGHLRSDAPDPVAMAAAARIKERHGAVRVRALARGAGLSLSALERRFRKAVGTSPRKFASIVRLRHVLKLRNGDGTLTETAYQAGYSDQAHFIKDFKNFTGLAPQSFFQRFRQSSFC
jgi:AraC-like DNA-binding protein